LEKHTADVANFILWEELSDVMSCGHSYGGAVTSGVADRIPDRIGALVYLDVFVLNNRQCVHDTLPAAQKNRQMEGVPEAGAGPKTAQCTMRPLAAFQRPIRLSGAIHGLRVPLSSRRRAGAQDRSAKRWKTVAIECGHDVMLDQPEELTRELLAVSPRAARA